MHIEQIKIENLRNIEHAEISPNKKLNIITGNNGAGKTTLLESIYLLARARSFRQQKRGQLLKEGKDHLNLFTTLKSMDRSRHQIGLQKTVKETVIRKDGEQLKKLSDLAKTIPLTIITPNIQRIIEEDPKHRRRLINWGMFHVEHEYGDLANRYKKVLVQRNKALRGSIEQIKVWDRQLIDLGEEIDRRMRAYTDVWNQNLQEIVDSTDLIPPISIELKQGWKEQSSLAEALDRSSRMDRERGFTSCGPQRSDLRVLQEGRNIRNIFSRGETKITAIILLLAQTKIIGQRRGENPVLLVDDLHSELDSDHYNRLLSLIINQNLQSFITSLNFQPSKDFKKPGVCGMFHVEHGEVSAQ
ncbi:MAG: DNA replication/repair protein RecF [gamma proteobacterium symbiont of Ctena orbiculata]|nr:MAG: DNA replication/repair protein RecF [gamma proteobacterium symbiont of Ctena orbiculata]PVV23467.1 MAG: DNA replication/repair protein RecF [gamma proteobacterium symbiont of Ctena orbiculata]PVV23519.1 MAG: DNA replication/repair protein RecF [gamma proteobacterium symbiont of Ctena orbiculata]